MSSAGLLYFRDSIFALPNCLVLAVTARVRALEYWEQEAAAVAAESFQVVVSKTRIPPRINR